MKKFLCIVLALVMALSLVACATNNAGDNTTDNTGDNTTNNTGDTTNNTGDDTTDDTADFDPSAHTLVNATVLINHPVIRCTELGFIEACEALGYQYKVVGTESIDANEMNAAGDAEAAAGASGVVYWGTDATFLTGVQGVKETYDIPTASVHMYWDPEVAVGLDACYGCDAETYAIQAAEWFVERLDGKTGSIAISQASMNAENENLCTAAFTARIAELQAEGKGTGLKVLAAHEEGAEDITESTNANAAVIQANPDLIGAISWTGNGPVTWGNAARKAGKAAGEILIAAMDYTAANLEQLASGYCSAIIAQPLYDQGYKAVEGIDKQLRGESIEYWTLLDAPMVYEGGEGAADPATYQGILDRVASTFGE